MGCSQIITLLDPLYSPTFHGTSSDISVKTVLSAIVQNFKQMPEQGTSKASDVHEATQSTAKTMIKIWAALFSQRGTTLQTMQTITIDPTLRRNRWKNTQVLDMEKTDRRIMASYVKKNDEAMGELTDYQLLSQCLCGTISSWMKNQRKLEDKYAKSCSSLSESEWDNMPESVRIIVDEMLAFQKDDKNGACYFRPATGCIPKLKADTARLLDATGMMENYTRALNLLSSSAKNWASPRGAGKHGNIVYAAAVEAISTLNNTEFYLRYIGETCVFNLYTELRKIIFSDGGAWQPWHERFGNTHVRNITQLGGSNVFDAISMEQAMEVNRAASIAMYKIEEVINKAFGIPVTVNTDIGDVTISKNEIRVSKELSKSVGALMLVSDYWYKWLKL